ncbi:hypothetical protein O3S80_07760 [Streptomyces sp. Lzd4kr]|nr:hypothetical protein [Streptomyces sp. Lzd4kr]
MAARAGSPLIKVAFGFPRPACGPPPAPGSAGRRRGAVDMR